MYPFLEASGTSLKNINKGIAAYLPKTTSTRKGAIALQLSDVGNAFDECNIIVNTSNTSETTGDESDNQDAQRNRVIQEALRVQVSWAAGVEHGHKQGRDARDPRSGSTTPLHSLPENRACQPGMSADQYRHNWHRTVFRRRSRLRSRNSLSRWTRTPRSMWTYTVRG